MGRARPITLVHDFLHGSAERLPDKVGLVCQGHRLPYAELEARSNALAHALVKRGVAPGDRVMVFAENTIETAIAFWAVLKANAVVSIVSALVKAEKLRHLLGDCSATALITAGHLMHIAGPAVRDLPNLKSILVTGPFIPSAAGELANAAAFDTVLEGERRAAPPRRACIDLDLAAIIYTSGSTGDPKGVMLTHRNVIAAATSITTYLENVEDDVLLGILPFAFGYGLYQLITASFVGARLVLEQSFTYPTEVLKSVVQERVTGFPGVPTIFARLGELKTLEGRQFEAVRYVTNAAAALPVKRIAMLKSLFPRAKIFSMYGLTECQRCTYLPPEDIDKKPTSIGVAIPNTELWIADEQGKKLGPGEVGQLLVRGSTVMRGYWNKPEATAEKLLPGENPGERVLCTGDLCTMDDEGYFYFVSRMDHVIKSRGEKVAPAEVEKVIYELSGVKEVAVIGVPDEVLGQAVKAFVVLEEGARLTVKEVLHACQQRLESFMVPKHVEFCGSLPKTDSGKIRKFELGMGGSPSTMAEMTLRSEP